MKVLQTDEHDFGKSLKVSHSAANLPIWEEIYRQAFPDFLAMHDHRQDGYHQRNGIDRSITLCQSKQILVDEKYRGRNKRTGEVYEDIALEYWSDKGREVRGWVCKPLLCDFIAYAIGPLGKCYLLPVMQLQAAWQRHGDEWIKIYPYIPSFNKDKKTGRKWLTVSVGVPPKALFRAIGQQLRFTFVPTQFSEDEEDCWANFEPDAP